MSTIEATATKVAPIVAGANRSEIHRRTGISLSGVSRILSGGRNARSANLSAVAECLGITMDELYIYVNWKRHKRRKSAA